MNDAQDFDDACSIADTRTEWSQRKLLTSFSSDLLFSLHSHYDEHAATRDKRASAAFVE